MKIPDLWFCEIRKNCKFLLSLKTRHDSASAIALQIIVNRRKVPHIVTDYYNATGVRSYHRCQRICRLFSKCVFFCRCAFVKVLNRCLEVIRVTSTVLFCYMPLEL